MLAIIRLGSGQTGNHFLTCATFFLGNCFEKRKSIHAKQLSVPQTRHACRWRAHLTPQWKLKVFTGTDLPDKEQRKLVCLMALIKKKQTTNCCISLDITKKPVYFPCKTLMIYCRIASSFLKSSYPALFCIFFFVLHTPDILFLAPEEVNGEI